MTTVARLLHTPVKSLRMTDVEVLELGPNGVVGDRIFFLVDDANQSLNQARRLPLCQATAVFDDGILSIALPDGTTVVGETPLGERFTAGFDMKSTIEATLVPGPWRDALSGWAGEPVRLARAADGRGGWSGFAASLIGTPTLDARRRLVRGATVRPARAESGRATRGV